MARAPPKERAAAKGTREGLRTRAKKVEYNVVKLSEKSAAAPPAPKKKAAAPKKKTTVKKSKSSGKVNYETLIKRALKNVEAPGWSVDKLLKYLEANYDKSNRLHLRNALAKGVDEKLFVKTRGSYRLSAKAALKLKKKATKKRTTKKTTKKAGTKKTGTKKTTKKTGTKKVGTKKAGTKKTTKKAGTKKTTTKKAGTKKTTTKKSPAAKKTPASPKKPAAKKPKKAVIAPPASTEGETAADAPIGETRGVWQYYDNDWHDYPESSNAIVEGVYQEYLTSGVELRPIKSGHFSYLISFANLTQQNTETGTSRKIRRV